MQENSIIKQNILKYLEYKGITPYKFYKDNDVTRGILTQNNGITEENLLKFIKFAQDISLKWLLTGEGDMIKSETQPNAASNTVSTPSECCEDGVISTLKDIIKEQAKEIARLELELEHYRSTDAATDNP